MLMTKQEAVLISIRPEWCEKIVNGKKTIEVRKTRPKLETPFKCYIYCTKYAKKQFWTGPKYSYTDDHSHNAFDKCGNGKVIGEFVCNGIKYFNFEESEWAYSVAPPGSDMPMHESEALKLCYKDGCLNDNDMLSYFGDEAWKAYFWHISNLKIYDTPKELSAFYRTCPGLNDVGMCWACDKAVGEEHDCGVNGEVHLSRPPQSWCYVYENN